MADEPVSEERGGEVRIVRYPRFAIPLGFEPILIEVPLMVYHLCGHAFVVGAVYFYAIPSYPKTFHDKGPGIPRVFYYRVAIYYVESAVAEGKIFAYRLNVQGAPLVLRPLRLVGFYPLIDIDGSSRTISAANV